MFVYTIVYTTVDSYPKLVAKKPPLLYGLTCQMYFYLMFPIDHVILASQATCYDMN